MRHARALLISFQASQSVAYISCPVFNNRNTIFNSRAASVTFVGLHTQPALLVLSLTELLPGLRDHTVSDAVLLSAHITHAPHRPEGAHSGRVGTVSCQTSVHGETWVTSTQTGAGWSWTDVDAK